MDLQRRLGILGFDPKHNQISSSLEDLARAAGAAKLARIVAESRYRMMSGMDPNTIEGSIETTPGTAPGELTALRAQIAAARRTMPTAGGDAGAEPSAGRRRCKAQIDEYAEEIDTEQNRLLTQAQAELHRREGERRPDHGSARRAEGRRLQAARRPGGVHASRSASSNRTARFTKACCSGCVRRACRLDWSRWRSTSSIRRCFRPVRCCSRSRRSSSPTTGLQPAGRHRGRVPAGEPGYRLRSIAEIESIIELPSLAIIPRARAIVGGAGRQSDDCATQYQTC